MKETQMYRKLMTHSGMSCPKAWTSISHLKSPNNSSFDNTKYGSRLEIKYGYSNKPNVKETWTSYHMILRKRMM